MPLTTGARLVDRIDLSEQGNGALLEPLDEHQITALLVDYRVQQRPLVRGERHAGPGSLSHAYQRRPFSVAYSK